MNVTKLISQLRAEQQQIDQAILALQRLGVTSGTKRRGRPPKWLSEAKSGEAAKPAKQQKRVVTAETRKKMAEAQRKRRAVRQAAEAAS